MALMPCSNHAEQVEEAHQGDIARHDNRNTLWFNGFGVVTKPSRQLLAVEHLCANGLHGTQDVRARKPTICSDSLINNAIARIIVTEARKSLTQSREYVNDMLHDYNILSAIAAHASASARAWWCVANS